MNVKHRYTKRQVARGTRPDAERDDVYFLFKNVLSLRVTYQIRLLAFRAMTERRKLVIKVPDRCLVHPGLKAFQTEYRNTVRIERTSA